MQIAQDLAECAAWVAGFNPSRRGTRDSSAHGGVGLEDSARFAQAGNARAEFPGFSDELGWRNDQFGDFHINNNCFNKVKDNYYYHIIWIKKVNA